ncbi:fumarylacetoacetate hydrolase family protein [Streptomyces sp. cg40]|uniref:fumarylacetoacetate hydrolase family protein n=1 Tax=Streptomyces sp. cg40 TaxID=3419764 RepID=UPI003D01B249
MRLATFVAPGESGPRSGDVRDGVVVSFDGNPSVADILATADRPVARGPEFALTDVRLLAPFRPRAVFMVGANYKAHVDAAAKVGKMPDWLAPGEIPCLLKGPGSPVGPSDPVVRPPEIRSLDYEGELMAVLGPGGRPVGYAVANDISARDVGDRWQLTRHKGGDTFCPWGPWITTADEIPDPYALRLRTWVDDELRQDGSTAEMIVRIPEIVDYIGKTIAVRQGDLLLTGTPAGTAAEMTDPRWLQPGQRVRVEIEGLGSIENTIVAG